ncbi:hypothetical protein RND81_07G145200 [Saponaria officinalis]|uniref:Uncharacterized protein n=1 Tax=Saponaria officinalis TaxID=3572 RepID=A0AAW1JUN5_SAPOF
MRTLISHYSNPNFYFTFPKIITKSTLYSPKKRLFDPQNTVFTIKSCFRASCIAKSGDSYNGWDDLSLWVDSDELGESNYIKKIIISLGIDDRKYVFTCILGFVIALAISRVRVSSIVVFPAVVIVFAIGFSFGFVNGGKSNNGFSLTGEKKREKGEFFRVYVEKLKILEDLFDGFDVKVSELKSVVKRGIDEERVDLSELESYVDVLDSIGGLVLNGRNVVDDCWFELHETEKKPNQKNSRKKKEIGSNGFDLLGFFGGFLRDYGTDSKSSKRNVLRKESFVKDVDNRAQRDVLDSRVEEGLDSVSTRNSIDPRVTSGIGSRKIKLGEGNREVETILQSDKMREMEDRIDSRSFLDDDNDKFNYQSMKFVNNRSFSFKMSSQQEIRKWSVDDSMSSYTEFDLGNEHLEDENYRGSQQSFGNSVGGYEFDIDFGNYKDSFKQTRVNVEDELHTRKYQPQTEKNEGPFSSTTVSDDFLFNKYLTNANDLLKQAKECLKVGNDEMFAEEMLHESAKLLSQAIALKPMSLLAIGQLGNTYLVHGELKLRASRALRNRLSRNEIFGLERQDDLFSSVDEARPNKDRIATLLGNTCEECEALLVQAGRKYRTALSIDGNDVRALYNWGLALFFRAQLIADIGPEAAVDADKLFLAAIDKFDAMMSRSNVYAPEALFRWGMALQQRSRLRPSSSRDKVKLLQQAKRLYKDALDMGSNNRQVRKALSSCMSELNFNDK